VLAKYYVGYQIEKNRMGRACGTYAGEPEGKKQLAGRDLVWGEE
jgi:hypothetical protein